MAKSKDKFWKKLTLVAVPAVTTIIVALIALTGTGYFKSTLKQSTAKAENNYPVIPMSTSTLSPKIQEANNSSEQSYVIFEQNSRYGIKDSANNILLRPIYNRIYDFHNGLACISFEGTYGFINRSFEIVIPLDDKKYTILSNRGKNYVYFNEGLIPYYIKDETVKKYGYIDTLGNVAIKPFLDKANAFNNNIALVKYKGSFGVLGKIGDFVVQPSYDEIKIPYDSGGYYAVKKNTLWGFLNSQNAIVIPLMYNDVNLFNKGLAKVWIDNKYSYININNECVQNCN